MLMTAPSGDIDIQRVPKRQPRPVHINDLNIVTDKRGRIFIRGVVVGIERYRARVTLDPRARFACHRRILEDQHRIRLHDIALIYPCACKRRLLEIVYIIRDEHFVEMSIGVREQNGRTAHAQPFGAASNPIRGIAGGQQEFSSWRTSGKHRRAVAGTKRCQHEQTQNAGAHVQYPLTPSKRVLAHLQRGD